MTSRPPRLRLQRANNELVVNTRCLSAHFDNRRLLGNKTSVGCAARSPRLPWDADVYFVETVAVDCGAQRVLCLVGFDELQYSELVPIVGEVTDVS
ncbi:Uncharacterised protein [Mycobacteroides abscessus subsp. bolletii]|nr:Uncharacterised protein [Mycobacteroides abscessus subsp. bolletii]